MLYHPAGELLAGGEPQLPQGLLHVPLRCTPGQHQLLGDLTVGQPLGDQAGYLRLPPRQPRDRPAGRGLAGAGPRSGSRSPASASATASSNRSLAPSDTTLSYVDAPRAARVPATHRSWPSCKVRKRPPPTESSAEPTAPSSRAASTCL